MNKQESSVSKTQEKYLLQTLDLIHQIIARKIGKLHFDSIEDVKQQVFLKLWRWKSERRDKELTEEEWLRFANTATHNEINNFFSNKHNQMTPFSQIDEGSEEAFHSNESATLNNSHSQETAPVETQSLLRLFWKLSQSLTLRQRCAYFFHQPDFLIDFISSECCSMKELADYFEITEAEFLDILERYPLSDEKIAEFLEEKFNKKISIQNIWKARSEAKKKLAKLLAGYIGDERTSDSGRT